MVDRASLLAALQHGDIDAIRHCRKLFETAAGDRDLLLALSEAELAAGIPQTGAILARYVAADPAWVEGQVGLASLRWELGDGAGFTRGMEIALRLMPGHAALWNAYIGTLAGAGLYREAAEAARSARTAGFELPILRLIEASHAGTAGELDRAEALLASVPDDLAEKSSNMVRHLIRKGELGAAAGIMDRLLAEQPGDLSLWALAELIWRATHDPREAWLSRDPQFIQTVELPFEQTDLDRLASLLRGLHRMRAQPIGQSIRGGTQTRGRLFDRIEPELVQLRTLLQRAVDDYQSSLPAFDAAHPLLRHRSSGLTVAGGWSVRLQDGGHHISHIHPAGVISSALYVALPQLNREDGQGWLELGRPPMDLRLTLAPLATIEPRPGRLVLFPSYLYHGTRSFAAGERLTVAFDAA